MPRQNSMEIVHFMVVMVTKNLITKKIKEKKNIKVVFVASLYSMTLSFMFDWIFDSRYINRLCFEKDEFEIFYKYRKDSVMISDNSILEVQGIKSVLIHDKAFDNVLSIPKLRMKLVFIIQVARKGYSFGFNSHSWCIKKGLATLVK